MSDDEDKKRLTDKLIERFFPVAFTGLAIVVIIVFLWVFFTRLYEIYFKG